MQIFLSAGTAGSCGNHDGHKSLLLFPEKGVLTLIYGGRVFARPIGRDRRPEQQSASASEYPETAETPSARHQATENAPKRVVQIVTTVFSDGYNLQVRREMPRNDENWGARLPRLTI
jgi:hypothetical protein